ncbi:hypothetical protein N5D_18570 [Enterococcus faecalis]|nr:hypothetical protein N5D_18570 [Enterococcus faecalis]
MAFIKENHIFLNQQLQTQEDVFHFLAKKSTELEVAQDAQEVFDKLNEREQEGTTGMMNGFAIPHALSLIQPFTLRCRAWFEFPLFPLPLKKKKKTKKYKKLQEKKNPKKNTLK